MWAAGEKEFLSSFGANAQHSVGFTVLFCVKANYNDEHETQH